MEYEVRGRVLEVLNRAVWRSGKSRTPVMSLPSKYLNDEVKEVHTILIEDDKNRKILLVILDDPATELSSIPL